MYYLLCDTTYYLLCDIVVQRAEHYILMNECLMTPQDKIYWLLGVKRNGIYKIV